VLSLLLNLIIRMSVNKTTIKEKVMPRPKGSGNRSEFVQFALAGIDAQIQQLQSQIEELTDMRKQLAKDGNVASATVAAKGAKAAAGAATKKKRVVSSLTKKRLREAAKARWAKVRAEKEGK
jgi:Arc/MetJ-type ribon-helix-helix transcriptional regulator